MGLPTLLGEATATLSELQRMYKLNAELLETLSVTAQWFRAYAEKQNITLPNLSTYNSLVNKAEILINEISNNESLSRRKVTDYRTDEEVPEPIQVL
jgi:hypothetical protein